MRFSPIRPAKLAAASALVIASVAIAPAVSAQDASQETPTANDDVENNTGLTTIVVTAQRREESVQDVPIAISAFDEGELARRGVTSALEVAQFVPIWWG